MRSLLPLLLGLVLVCLAPRRASACWDGFLAATPHLTVMGSDTQWSLSRAEHLAEWLPRIEALLAARGVTVEASFGQAYFDDETVSYEEREMDRLFDALADALGASDAERRRAMSARGDAHTVQLAATRDLDAARALAARINEQEEDSHGFYEAGGFPARNDVAHVVEVTGAAGQPVYRVLVGTFLDRAEASRVAALLRPITGEAFLRRL